VVTAGQHLPSGRIRLKRHCAWLWDYCVGGKPDAAAPNPSVGWFLAVRGCGIPLDELLGLFEIETGTSPVLGEAELEFHSPIRIEADYRTESTIAEVDRKVGGSGPFDRIVLRVDVIDAENDRRVCTLRNTMIVPRSGTG
jgi:hypothetical protein